MPHLNALAQYRAAQEPQEAFWRIPYAQRVAGIPTGTGRWRLASGSESLDKWDDYRAADTLQLSPYDSEGDSYGFPDLVGSRWSLTMDWIRRAQSLKFQIDTASRSASRRQPHNSFGLTFLSAEGATTTADPGEPVLVSVWPLVTEIQKQFWVRLLPTLTMNGLTESSTGELDVALLQRFATRFDPMLKPGFMFEFEGEPYVVKSVSRPDRRRNLILTTEEIGGASG